MTESSALAERIDRLESIDAIRQLASRYALALDAHDMDRLVECFAEDIYVGRLGTGRDALKQDFDRRFRTRGYRATTHFVGNHVIEFVDADHAIGVVYCRAEHEFPDELIVGPLQYFDDYERMDGRWFFRRRRPMTWYFTDVLDRPVGDTRVRWPGADPVAGELPQWWPSWDAFWAADETQRSAPVPAPGTDDTFLRRLRPPALDARASNAH